MFFKKQQFAIVVDYKLSYGLSSPNVSVGDPAVEKTVEKLKTTTKEEAGGLAPDSI